MNLSNLLNSKKYKKAYCIGNFTEDYTKLGECRGQGFCTLCCENEFGNLHMDKRQNCIDTLCAVKPPEPEDGRWVWTGANKDLVSANPFAPVPPK